MFAKLFNPAIRLFKHSISGRAYAGRGFGVSDLLMYATLIDDGIILQTDGSYLASFWYRGGDLETSSDSELNVLSSQLNNAFNLLGSGWLFHIDTIRYAVPGYIKKSDCYYEIELAAMIDEERRGLYESTDKHYENAYAISLTYRPKVDLGSKFGLFFRKKNNSEIFDYKYYLVQFKAKIDEFIGLLGYGLNLSIMDSQTLLSYISWCLTGEKVKLNLPIKHGAFLKHYISACDLVGGESPKLGDRHMRCVTIMGFPNESYPAILDKLNYIDFAYRFNTRFILINQYEGGKLIDRLSNLWYQKRISAIDTVKLSLAIDSNIRVNKNSQAQYQDAETAKALNDSGNVKFGFYTASVIIMHHDLQQVENQATQIRSIFQNLGFQSQIERHHAVEAFLGTLPGYSYANVRKWLIHTQNVADIVPNTSIWSGLDHNPCSFYIDNNPPLFYARTTGYTPLRLSLHVADIGHTLILGPTGSGKSTLLNFIIAQHFRYKNSRVFVFDKNKSSLPLCYGCDGSFYDIGSEDNQLFFQPLYQLESDLDFDFAASWLEDLCILNGMEKSFDDTHRQAIRRALKLMCQDTPKERRTLSYFRHLVQDYDQAVSSVLDSFCQEKKLAHDTAANSGFIAKIFDGGSQDFSLEQSKFNVFEMGNLMQAGDRVIIPALKFLVHSVSKQFDTCLPTLIVFDESFLFFRHFLFREKIIEWVKTARKFNVAIIFATQEIADLFNYKDLLSALKTNCSTKIFLPNPQALTEDIFAQYKSMDLNEKQINLIAHSYRGEYFYVSTLGRRKFSLDLSESPLTFNFTARTSLADINLAIRIKEQDNKNFIKKWLNIHEAKTIEK
ncbi:MAG: virB4 1 [Burkholderiales bacterium]|jgi:type IV secretion system protein VirB4|nr:virB4 1 [Burkholderiales bacterium]